MTFSIVARSADGQSWGVAVASKFLAVGSVVPAAVAGIGAIATQAEANVAWKAEALSLLGEGVPASETMHRLVVDAFNRKLKVAAICHGVLLAARSVDPATGRSVLYGRRTTALTWALERTAWRLTKLTRFWDRDYYRTYREEPGQPSGYMSVQSEVTRALEDPSDFRDVEKDSPHYRTKTSGMARDTATDSRPAFVVDDGDYLSARWPGDTHTFAKVLSDKL